jgi:hypothetical protein
MLQSFQASMAVVLLPLCASQLIQLAELPLGMTSEIQNKIELGQSWWRGHQVCDGNRAVDGVGPASRTSGALIILQMPHSLVPIYQRSLQRG